MVKADKNFKTDKTTSPHTNKSVGAWGELLHNLTDRVGRNNKQ